MNLIRFSVDPEPANPETREGYFTPEHLRWIDNIVLLAFKHAIRLLICVQDSGLPSDRYERERQRWKSVVDRWGNSGVVMGWEIDPTSNHASGVGFNVSSFIRAYERQKWGRSHLITIADWHAGRKVVAPFGADWQEHNDLADIGQDASENVSVWATLGAVAKRASARISPSNLPRLEVEPPSAGPYKIGEDAQTLLVNEQTWLELATGDAGPGVIWTARPGGQSIETLPATFARIQRFSTGVDWTLLGGRRIPVGTNHIPPHWLAAGFMSSTSGILWAAGPNAGGRIGVQMANKPLSGHFKAYDCDGGKWLASGSFRGSIPIPAGLRSVIFLLSSK